jgi:predicted nucleotidyltransferase
MSIITYHKHPNPLQGLSLKEFTDKLKQLLAGRAQSAWLYGSVARGDAGPESDIDLFIVAETDLPFHERGRLFEDLRDFNVNIEALIYTPAEWARLTSEPTVGFWQSAVREMVRLV